VALRVLYVIPGEEEGPSFVFARRQVDAMIRSGVQAARFFLRSRTSPVMLLAERKRFRAGVQSFKPDLVHAHFGSVTALFCALCTSKPLVVTYRGSDLNPSPGDGLVRHLLGHLLSQLAALRASGIICVSEQLKSRLWWGRSGARAAVITESMDLGLFRIMPRELARQELAWAASEKVVLFNYAGRAPKGKRLDLAQAAVACARERTQEPLRLEVLDGRTQPDRIPLLLNAADCLLVTSDYEGSPTIVKEALACNLPVVSVEAGDVPERIRHVQPSCIVRRDPEALGEALAGILAHPVRSNGREILERELPESQMVEQILGVYRRALA